MKKSRGELLMGKVCRFKFSEKEKVNLFKPDEILGYRFDGDKYFVSKEINARKFFLNPFKVICIWLSGRIKYQFVKLLI
jgi:hypothetical protein